MGPAFPPAPFLRPSDLLPLTSRSPGRWPAAWRCSRPVVSRLPGLASPSPVAGSIDGRPVPSGGAGMTARWPEGHPCHRRRPPGGSVTALACRLALPCDLRVTFLAECAVCDRRQAVEACRNAHPSARLMRYLRFASPCRCQRGKRVFRYRRGLSPPVRKPRSSAGFRRLARTARSAHPLCPTTKSCASRPSRASGFWGGYAQAAAAPVDNRGEAVDKLRSAVLVAQNCRAADALSGRAGRAGAGGGR